MSMALEIESRSLVRRITPFDPQPAYIIYFFRAVVWSTKGATMLGLQRVHVTLASRRVVVPHTPLNDEEDSRLQAFDLETAYGPCLGLSRKERWLRAEGAWPATANPLSIRRAFVS